MQGTLPTWDFGGNKAAAITGRHAAALGTLRSADARDTRYLTSGSAGSLSGSFTGTAGGSFSGTAKAAHVAGSGTGTVARADGWAMQQQLGVGEIGSSFLTLDAARHHAAPPDSWLFRRSKQICYQHLWEASNMNISQQTQVHHKTQSCCL